MNVRTSWDAREWTRRLENALRASSGAEVLEAVGMLRLLGAEGAARECISGADLQSIAATALASLETSRLDAAALRLVDDANELFDLEPLDPGAIPSPIATRIRDALSARTNIEIVMLGAELVVGREAQGLPPDLATSLMSFEDLVQPIVWKLAPLARYCSDEITWMNRRFRSRFWWLTRLASVDPASLQHLVSAAAFLEQFTEAEEEFEYLREAARHIDRSIASRVVSLAAWVRARGSQTMVGIRTTPPLLAVGFASGTELLNRPDLVLFWEEPDALVLDLMKPAKRAPLLLPSDGEPVPGQAVSDALERYRWDLNKLEVDGPWQLQIEFDDGAVEIDLPPHANAAASPKFS